MVRCRPNHFDFHGSGLDSFSNWFPMLGNPSWDQSFPSSHAATAAAMAIVLACYYPRGRWLFPVFAVFAGGQRVLEQSHFLSDVLWGASIGCIFAPLCVYGSRLSRVFDRLEERLLARSGIIAHVRAEQTPRQAHADRASDNRRAKSSVNREAPVAGVCDPGRPYNWRSISAFRRKRLEIRRLRSLP